jgi:hypothetical protein
MPQLLLQRPDLMQHADPVEHPVLFLVIISLFLLVFALAMLFRNS